jgi:hypothetical protein
MLVVFSAHTPHTDTQKELLLLVVMFIHEHRRLLVTAFADTIPEVLIADVSLQAPNELARWYSAHLSPSITRNSQRSPEEVLPHDTEGKELERG